MSVRLWFWLVLIASILSPAGLPAQKENEHETKLILPQEKVKLTGERPDLKLVAKLILTQTNDFRKSEKREKVVTQAQLQETAQYFADYMAKTNKYGHAADESQPHERAGKHGYVYCIVSENIGYAFNSSGFSAEKLSSEFAEGWEKSPPHRKNMLDPDVTEIGIAVARSEETGYYFGVQMFGRPKSAVIQFDVANKTDTKLEYKLGAKAFPLPPGVTRTHQICRPLDLIFRWPETEQDVPALRPKPGDKITITREDGKYRFNTKSQPAEST